MLLPVLVLARRADVTAVIGSDWWPRPEARDIGGSRPSWGRAAETVRGWLRRLAGRLESVRVVFTELIHHAYRLTTDTAP